MRGTFPLGACHPRTSVNGAGCPRPVSAWGRLPALRPSFFRACAKHSSGGPPPRREKGNYGCEVKQGGRGREQAEVVLEEETPVISVARVLPNKPHPISPDRPIPAGVILRDGWRNSVLSRCRQLSDNTARCRTPV